MRCAPALAEANHGRVAAGAPKKEAIARSAERDPRRKLRHPYESRDSTTGETSQANDTQLELVIRLELYYHL
jgi:hypothetical protein